MIALQHNTHLQGGKYRIIRFISSGGFGCTYEAEHVLLKKRVAIKEFFVKDFCNRDEETFHVTVGTQSKKGLVEKLRLKFIDEARSLSQLHHPGIVSVADVFEENGTAYFVMDYVEGHSLNEIVNQEGPLSEERAVRYIRQVAEALQYVHDNNRLHLDIKPGNIMINLEDRPVLIDFGASKQYDELDGENTSTLMGKTPGYAPPEQMSNSVVKFMPATDIYALGATLYKLLTGITPLDVNLRISGEELEPMPQNISAAIRDTVAAAMAINKKNRPQNLQAFLTLLKASPAPEIVKEEDTIIEVKENEGGVVDDPKVGQKTPAGKSTREAVPQKRTLSAEDNLPAHGRKVIGACIITFLVLVALFLLWRNQSLLPELVKNESKIDNEIPASSSTESLLQEKMKEVENLLPSLPEEPIFNIVTNLGTIKVKLYSKTPKHRENFERLALIGYYDGLLFHRVIDGFMIQGGDPLTRDSSQVVRYGTGGPAYTVPAEFVPEYRHKKGALAAARRGDAVNPAKESSGSQFYIVQDERACSALDGDYTVFGETIEGFDVIDKIAKVSTNDRDLPLTPVRILEIQLNKVSTPNGLK